MNCPRHGVDLSPELTDDGEINRCSQCEGIWIPGAAIDALLGSGERLKLSSLCSARESQLACPHDGKTLGEAIIGGVTLDFCLSCHGLWLDAGELDVLKARPRMRKTARSVGAAKLEGETGWATADVTVGILDLLGGFVS